MKELYVQVCSDLDYESMVVDISSEKGRIATISCDEGIQNAKIKFFDNESEKVIWDLNYKQFESILCQAFKKLTEINQKEK